VAGVTSAGRGHRPRAKSGRGARLPPHDIRAIRLGLYKSQAEFARMIGVSVSTLRNWEQGRRHPEGAARALLRVTAENPNAVAHALGAISKSSAARS
jgi:putative transcriptional regulator